MGYFSRSTLATCTAPRGRASIHTLDWVDRVDHPGGRSKFSPPGSDAAHYLSTHSVSEVAFEELFAEG